MVVQTADVSTATQLVTVVMQVLSASAAAEAVAALGSDQSISGATDTFNSCPGAATAVQLLSSLVKVCMHVSAVLLIVV